MAGTLFSLALSQRFDAEGNLLIDAPIYIYDANTSTPVDVYQDFGLSILHPWPFRTDSVGMIPAFWLEDGNYRVRMTDEAGATVFFDLANVQALGPSSGEEGGGGGESVDTNAIFQTGDMLWQPRSGTRSGWVRANGRSIGSAISGATERANADTQALYEFLWNTFSNAICPVTGGRGVSAASDFSANKAIGLIDMRGRCAVGLDDMGNSVAGVITADTPTTAGSVGGAEKAHFTLARNQLPNVTLDVDGMALSDGLHGHPARYSSNPGGSADGSGGIMLDLEGASNSPAHTGSPANTRGDQIGGGGTHTHDVEGETESINGGVAQQPVQPNVMNPYRLGSWYIKL